MRKRSWIISAVAVLLAVGMIGLTAVTAGADGSRMTEEEINAVVNTETDPAQITSPFIEVANQVRNSVVGVNNYASASSYYGYGYYYGYGREPRSQDVLRGTGSGVVITEYGHVLTNYHVVENSSRVTVTTAQDQSEHEAQVVCYDSDLDIAVLLVPDLKLPAVPLGDSDQLQVGEWAIVIGNPLGEDFARTLTVGVVSAIDRQITDSTLDRYGRRTTVTNTMIQVDAAINSGNSGGGMFNTLGQLQGIPARKYSSNMLFSTSIESIGMCIPINVAKPLIAQALKEYDGEAVSAKTETREDGGEQAAREPLRGKPRLGVVVTTLVSDFDRVLPQGALVRSVDAGSPAEKAGLQAGDIIVECDGAIIASSDELTEKLKGFQEGDSVTLKVYRDTDLQQQMRENYIDYSKLGKNYDWVEITVQLKVLDQVDRNS
ncbi:MAG: trypsin-like peptidase domain-containing protein [Clostridia bacterium]|nr:trypsin-like peptidase domain-containing protein [Clostridia bacterium]MCR4886968.1 S1C family serine protease [Clostridiales bacterium]